MVIRMRANLSAASVMVGASFNGIMELLGLASSRKVVDILVITIEKKIKRLQNSLLMHIT